MHSLRLSDDCVACHENLYVTEQMMYLPKNSLSLARSDTSGTKRNDAASSSSSDNVNRNADVYN